MASFIHRGMCPNGMEGIEMSTTVRVAFAAVAIFLFLLAALGSWLAANQPLALGFLGLACLTFVALPEPASRHGLG
jgi:hypothetical protein